MVYIRKRREALGLSTSELAARVGVAPASISQYESGYASPTLKTALALASVLGCTVEDLTKKEVNENA